MEKTHIDPGEAPLPRPTAAAGSVAPVPDPTELRTLGEYRLLRKLGEGGMGQVYLAFDGHSDRHVAIKVLDEGLAASQGYVDRFYREARSGSMLEHPNIVHTFRAGLDRATNRHYLVMEYVDGPSAHAILAAHGPMPVGDAVHLALDVARALEHAHSRNIVHRDIKPDNILVTRSGVAKLADMGLAKRTDEASHLTLARQGFGTTAYMPYEQAINAKQADGRSDIYALGATLYHLVTGKVPFPGESHVEVVDKKNSGWFAPASHAADGVPAALDLMLSRMLAREPRDRYQTASELLIDLERSKLAAPIPTYADPDLARDDPLVQAALGSGEPTRLDPSSLLAEPMWIVCYRNRSGRPLTTRLTAEDVIERLKEGTLPGDAEARRPEQDEGRPLTAWPEFAPFVPPPEEAREPAPSEARPGWLIAGLLLGGALACAAALVAVFRLLAGR